MLNSKENLKRISVGLAAMMLALTMAGCSSAESGDADKADSKASAAAENSEKEEESKSEEAEDPKEENEEQKEDGDSSEAAVTTAPSDIDLDSMIASIEADIPQVTAFSGIDIGGSKPEADSSASASADTSSAAEAVTTTTTTMPEANAPVTADLKSNQQLVFDGMIYDNTNILDSAITPPSGWTDQGFSNKDYQNPLYPNVSIVESDGVVQFVRTRNEGGALPELQLYKGLTWGATASDVKAAYGEPVHEGSGEQYGTTFTTLYYKDSNDYLIIYSVSDDWGLFEVSCQGKY